jgi:tetratricopeptide (TPR) repeat protein
MQTNLKFRPWMLTYTIVLGLGILLMELFYHNPVPNRDPLVYTVWSDSALVVLFAGNLLYSFGRVTKRLRTIWKFVGPIVILQFIVSGVVDVHLHKHASPLTPAVAVASWITMLLLFFPSFRANFLLGYANLDRVRTIAPPAMISEDPLRELLAEIRRLRRASQVAWTVTILLLTIGIVGAFFQVRFEKPHGDSWVTVRQLADAAKYEEALAVAHRLVDKDPDSPQTRVLMGTLQLSLGQLHQAEASFTRAYELLPSEANASILNAIRKRIDESESNSPSNR